MLLLLYVIFNTWLAQVLKIHTQMEKLKSIIKKTDVREGTGDSA